MTCIRNYDQSTGIYAQAYNHDFAATKDQLPTIQILYQSQTIKSTTKKKIQNSTESWLVTLRKKTKTISKKIQQCKYLTSGPLKALLRILSPPTVENMFQSNQSPSGPVYTKKNTNDFRIYKTDLNMKIHFKTARGKRLRIPSRTTAGGSSSLSSSVPGVDAALRSLSAFPIGTVEASTDPP